MSQLFTESSRAKPFLKWAGGKGQLIAAIESALPINIHAQKKLIYVEPFVGSGAIMFWFLKKFPYVQRAVINDINADLVHTYEIIKKEPYLLIKELAKIQEKYYKLDSENDRRLFFL